MIYGKVYVNTYFMKINAPNYLLQFSFNIILHNT